MPSFRMGIQSKTKGKKEKQNKWWGLAWNKEAAERSDLRVMAATKRNKRNKRIKRNRMENAVSHVPSKQLGQCRLTNSYNISTSAGSRVTRPTFKKKWNNNKEH